MVGRSLFISSHILSLFSHGTSTAGWQRCVERQSHTRLDPVGHYEVRLQDHGCEPKGEVSKSLTRSVARVDRRCTLNLQEVLLRVPMHKIGWVVHYTEHTGQQVLIIESGVAGGENFKYFLYQTQSEVCLTPPPLLLSLPTLSCCKPSLIASGVSSDASEFRSTSCVNPLTLLFLVGFTWSTNRSNPNSGASE